MFAQAAPILPIDLDLLLKLGGILVALALGWGALQSQAKATEKRLDAFQAEFERTLKTVRDEAQANRQLSQEALRQATAAHTRCDAITMSVQAQEVNLGRLAERVDLTRLRRTQPIHMGMGEE